MRLCLFTILFCFAVSSSNAQNVVGMRSGEVKSYFKANYPDLSLESNISNDYYRYLKYSDAATNKITVLAFLNEKERCSAVRFIYDLSLEGKVLKELDRKFIKTGTHTWEDTRNTRKVNIVYEKEEWFITVNYKEE